MCIRNFEFCYFELECGFCSHTCFIVAMNADMHDWKPSKICLFCLFWTTWMWFLNKLKIKGWSMFILCKDCKQESESENIVKWVFILESKFYCFSFSCKYCCLVWEPYWEYVIIYYCSSNSFRKVNLKPKYLLHERTYPRKNYKDILLWISYAVLLLKL